MGRWKKCSTFSCFTGSSASRHDPSSLNGTPGAPVPKSSHPSNDTRLATTNPQSTAPLADPSASQLYVPPEVQNDSPSIGPSDEPSSTSAEGSSSNPSSSVHEERYHTQQIRGAPAAVDPRNEEAYLDDLSDYVSNLLASIKGEGNKPSPVSATWPGSRCLFKLRDVLSDVAQISKDLCPDAKTIAQRFLEGMGAVHMLTTGFLVVANIMERWDKIKENETECEYLLEKMNTLIQYVKQLHKNPGLKEGMETQIEKAVELIIEVTLACYTQTKKEKYMKFFSTTVNQEELVNLKDKLSELRVEIQMQMGLYAIEQIDKLLAKRPVYPKYPHAYGIGKQVENVIRLLEWESDKTGIAVILYGLGGMGKTTLADAVFDTLRAKENMGSVKYSFVRLFENMGLVPNIPELQTYILRDLKMGEVSAIPEIQRYNEGQSEIAVMLEEKEAFIYIDGVLFPDKVEQGRDAIEELLPTNMRNAKKLRLLITARDKGAAGRVCIKLGLKTNFYPIETLQDTEATMLVKENLNGEELIDSRKIEQIVDICGGIPRLLIQVATFIRYLEDRQEAQTRYTMVISESENKWNGEIGQDIARYVFAYENFDKILTDPFLDICSYFQGWQWEELSNIFGDVKLSSLENRALVTKDVRSMTARIHKVILAIGLNRTEGERSKFTSGSEFQDFLDTNTDEDLSRIKGIWSNDNIGPLDIPASKLDLMCRSLRVLALQNSTKVSGRCNQTFEQLFFFSAQISDNPFDPSKVKKLRHSGYRPDDFHNLCQGSSNEESVERNNDMQEQMACIACGEHMGSKSRRNARD